MRISKIIAIYILALVGTVTLSAQTSSVTYTLDATTNGTTVDMPAEGFQLQDDGGSGTYSKGRDWYFVCSNTGGPCAAPNVLALSFSHFDIAPEDTLYIYDGPSTSSPLLLACNNNHNPLNGARTIVYASPTNNRTTHALTVRFRTAVHQGTNTGFFFYVTCLKPCEIITPHIDTIFERTRNGIVYAQDVVRYYDEKPVITMCAGDGVRIHGYGDYTNFTGHYTPSDATSRFTWTFDDDDHVQSATGMDHISYGRIDTLGCHKLILEMVDGNGCEASMLDQIQIRVATNPIRTISNLGTVCENDELEVVVSYDANSTLGIDSIEIRNIHTRTNEALTFIPDGPRCASGSARCYSAPVTFDEFPTGSTVTSAGDICSICVNYEHEFMGDYDLVIVCPNGRKATLKYKDNTGGLPVGAYEGGGIFTGYPYGGNEHHSWDGSDACDASYNAPGIGLDYCFSRNGDYTLVDGQPANTTRNGPHYLANSEYQDAVTVTFDPIPAAYSRSGASSAGSRSFSTKHPSDHANRRDYYKPADNFSTLVGCPLNGTWKIQICDNWEQDNGWVFGWSLDICNISDEDDCEYNVKIDSITWDVTPESGRFNPTHVRRDVDDPWKFYFSATDTAGLFNAEMHVYDEFGCKWDSVGYYTVLWNPKPELGDDPVFCQTGTSSFDAADNHARGRGYRYSYEWSTGETTQIISPTAESTTWYKVAVTNQATNGSDARCVGIDSVAIIVGVHPIALFGPDPDSLDVLCSPYTMAFENLSTNAEHYLWTFGDGASSTNEEPLHTYSTGTYTVTLYAISRDGCRDTFVWKNYAKVNSPSETAFGAMLCKGAEYTWIDGVTYYEPTTSPTVVLKSAIGCDSILHLNLGLDNKTKAKIHAMPEIASHDNGSICLYDYGVNSYRRTWWMPDGSTTQSEVACFDFPVEQDSVRVILAIESEYGCTDTTSMIIRMDKSNVWMPNIFTPYEPNNNTVRVECFEVDQLECTIYDRRGQMVYKFKDKDDVWNGRIGDKIAPQGVYVYLVRYTTIHDTERWRYKKGTIILAR